MIIQIVKYDKQGNKIVAATVFENKGKVTSDPANFIQGEQVLNYLGDKKTILTPEDGKGFMRNLVYKYRSPYMRAELLSP
jgi:hypothetical protein